MIHTTRKGNFLKGKAAAARRRPSGGWLRLPWELASVEPSDSVGGRV